MLKKNCENSSPKRLLTKPELADYFSTTTRTIEVWMRNGYIPFLKIGHTVRFCLEDVLAQLRERNSVPKHFGGNVRLAQVDVSASRK